MLSKSLIQFSVDNFLCSLPVIYLGPNYGGGNENGPSKGPMQALLHSVPPTLQQPTAKPFLHQRLLDTHGPVWVSVLWGHCSFLLGPGAHKVFFVPSKSLFPVLCKFWRLSGGVNGDLLQEGLCHTQVCFHPEPLPQQQSTADLYLHMRHSNTVLSQSLWCS